jgi:hypothetical protein
MIETAKISFVRWLSSAVLCIPWLKIISKEAVKRKILAVGSEVLTLAIFKIVGM